MPTENTNRDPLLDGDGISTMLAEEDASHVSGDEETFSFDSVEGSTALDFGVPVEPDTKPEPDAEKESQSSEPKEEKPWEPKDLPDHYTSPEDAYGAAAYWQGERDKAVKQIQEKENLLSSFGEVRPVAEAIMEDPQLLSMVADYLTGSSSTGESRVNQTAQSEGPAGAASGNSVKTPQPPQKPSNMDPYSEEYQRYQEEYSEYLDNKLAHNVQLLDRKFETVEQQIKRLEHEREAEQRQKQAEILRKQAVIEAQHVHGLNRVDAEKFVAALESGEIANNMELLVSAWRSKAASESGAKPPEGDSPARNLAHKSRTTLAASQPSSKETMPRSDADVIGDALEAEYGGQSNDWI